MKSRARTLETLAVGGTKRNPQLPEFPTIAETVSGYSTYIWWGMFAPLKTPPDLVNRMNSEVNSVLASPDVRKKLEVVGAVPEKMSAAGSASSWSTRRTSGWM